MRTPQEEQEKNIKQIGSDRFRENLNIEQRNQLKSMLKKMLPPVPSIGIIDIRFSFWFFRQWYVVFIFGRDTREGFKTLDKGDVDRSLSIVAKATTYIVMMITILIMLLFLLYALKSVIGIDLFPDKHLSDFLPWK
ncbi:hypothetical protein JEZ13_08165 [bacterium]|nr:hypothetical protein [bacterium]